jgi:hypothetical protein
VVGVRVSIGSRIFLTLLRPVLGPTQFSLQWVPEALSPRIKFPGREAVHSPPTTAEVKKMWIYKSAPPYAFMAECTWTNLHFFTCIELSNCMVAIVEFVNIC